MNIYELPEDLFLSTVRLIGQLSCETAAPLYVALTQVAPKITKAAK